MHFPFYHIDAEARTTQQRAALRRPYHFLVYSLHAGYSVTCSTEDKETLCDDLRTELTNISEWMRQNKLSHNANKSEFLIFGHKRQLNGIHEPVQLKVDEEPIRSVQTVKYLGLRVDENLSRNEQYKSLKCKVNSGLSSIRKLKDIFTPN